MGGNQFDQIAQEVIKQKQRMDKLQAENDDLHQQIADLRSGRGIFVDILGSRFALKDDSSFAQANSASATSSTTSPSTSEVSASKIAEPSTTQPFHKQIVDTPTTVMTEITSNAEEQSVHEQALQAKHDVDTKAIGKESTFLEEILIDEFNNALTSPNAVWQDPAEKKQSQRKSQEQTAEEQKAALRRELMGSFLLE